MGLLAINDRTPDFGLESSDVSGPAGALIGVARIQRDFLNQSTLGFLFTNRGRQLAAIGPPATTTSRGIFIKLSYLLLS